MSFSKASALAGVLSLVSSVAAHGIATGLVADGVYYEGFSPNFKYMQNPPKVAGWSTTYQDNGFIAPSQFTTSDVICHLGATPGGATATVTAGSTVDIQWNTWPESHKGPVLDYLASCNGDCTTVDKTSLKFFKIDGPGLVDGSTPPGTWASDNLIANNNTWTVTIPSDIAPGNYVLRHEIIALHSAGNADGAQNYPQCFNLKVVGGGSATPAGIAATEFYTPTDPGILFNIYTPISSYPVPGPEIYSGGGGSSPAPTSAAASSSAAASTPDVTPIATSSAGSVPTSSPAVTSAPSPSPIIPPFTNGTIPSSTKKSACKPKTKTPTSTPTAAALPVSTATVVPLPATPTATPSSPASQPSPTATGDSDTLPAGTKLSTVLKWISNFYAQNGDGEYVPNTPTATRRRRRHARHLAF